MLCPAPITRGAHSAAPDMVYEVFAKLYAVLPNPKSTPARMYLKSISVSAGSSGAKKSGS